MSARDRSRKAAAARSRGRHKRATSPEPQRWAAEHLPPTPPAWLDPQTAAQLLELRRELDPLGHA